MKIFNSLLSAAKSSVNYLMSLLKRLRSPQTAKEVILEIVATFPVFEVDPLKVLQAININAKYGYSYWDSLILATALVSNCAAVYSEDMHHDQLIEDKLRIVNPF